MIGDVLTSPFGEVQVPLTAPLAAWVIHRRGWRINMVYNKEHTPLEARRIFLGQVKGEDIATSCKRVGSRPARFDGN